MGLFDLFKKKETTAPVPMQAQETQKAKTLTAKVVGTKYHDYDKILALGTLNPDYSLDKRGMIKKYPDGHTAYEYIFPELKATLEPEPTNEEDPNAIKVLLNGLHAGYIKKGSCSRIKNLIAKNEIVDVIASIRGGNSKILSYTCGIDEKPTSTDYEFEKEKGDIYIDLTLMLK